MNVLSAATELTNRVTLTSLSSSGRRGKFGCLQENCDQQRLQHVGIIIIIIDITGQHLFSLEMFKVKNKYLCGIFAMFDLKEIQKMIK